MVHRLTLYSGQSHTEVLRDTWINAHGCTITGFVCISRHEIHVHKRGFAGLIELVLRHHRVVPVQHLLVCHFRSKACCRQAGHSCDQDDQGRAETESNALKWGGHGWVSPEAKCRRALLSDLSRAVSTRRRRVSTSWRRASITEVSSPVPAL